MLRKQIGSSLMPVMLLLGGAGTTAAIGYAGYQNQNQQTAIARYIAEDVQQIQSAAMLYLSDNNINSFDALSNPNALNMLAQQGYYTGSLESPMGSFYRTRVDDASQEFIVEVDATVSRYARRSANIVTDGEVFGGTSIRSSIRLPSRSELYGDLVSRYADPRDGYEYRQQFEMGVQLDMGENDFTSVGSISAERTVADVYNIQNVRTSELETDELRIGNASLTSSGSDLNVASSSTAINSNVALAGDLTGQGGSATGIGTLQGESAQFASADFEDLTSQQLDAQTFTSSTGQIDSVQGQTVSYSTGSFVDTSAENIRASQAAITNLSGTLLDYSTASFESLQSANLSIASALNPGGNAGSSGRFNNATASTGTAGSATVSGQLSANNLIASSAISTSNEFEATGQASVTSTEATGSASAGNVEASSVTSRDLYVTTAAAAELRGRRLAGSAGTGQNMTSSAFSTQNSTIGTGTITTLGFGSMSGSAGGARSISLTRDLSARSASLSGDLTARNFNATNDVSTTSGNSINSNHALINNLGDDLEECVSSSGICMPRTPTVSLGCQGGCTQESQSEQFTFTLSASVSNCARGCTFEYSIPSSVGTGTCTRNGTVSPGNNTVATCRINVNGVDAGETAINQISFTAYDARNNDFSTTRSVNLSAENTDPGISLDDILLSGCQVNNIPNRPQATVTEDFCMTDGASTMHFPGLGISVGDATTPDGSSYIFGADWTTAYSFDWNILVAQSDNGMPINVNCTGYYCIANSYVTPAEVVVDVTVTDNETGEQVTRRIHALDCTVQGEMAIPCSPFSGY